MSRIKYYIFVFFVLISISIYPQNSYEGDNVLEKNEIDVAVYNAEQESQRGNYYEAIKILNQTLLIAEKIDDPIEKGKILSKLAKVQYSADEIKEAKINITKAINVQASNEDKVNLAVSRYTYGLIYLGENDFNNALDYFKSSKTIFEEEQLNELIAEVTLSEAKANIGLQNLPVANALLDKTIILSTKYEIPLIQSAAFINSGKVALMQEKFDRALA
ncbi:MAG: hypothetical protein KJO77_07865, partial [Bacteroidia bacterium]|nr:hypothetical protein [Bacteroidia bacterium]